jgi:hypothetical protein
MKRKLHLHRETVRNLAASDLSGAQGGAAGRPTANYQSCVLVCATAAVSCGGTCQYTQCPNLCQVAGTSPCIIPILG